MAVTNYDTVNGRLRGEVASGVRTGYLTDALGSVTATVQAAAVVNTYRYKPYGSQLAKTGVGADPKFLYVGTASYRKNSSSMSPYVRMRHYDESTGSWTTRDPLFLYLTQYSARLGMSRGNPQRWPHHALFLGYVYARQSPVSRIDPSGLKDCPDQIAILIVISCIAATKLMEAACNKCQESWCFCYGDVEADQYAVGDLTSSDPVYAWATPCRLLKSLDCDDIDSRTERRPCPKGSRCKQNHPGCTKKLNFAQPTTVSFSGGATVFSGEIVISAKMSLGLVYCEC